MDPLSITASVVAILGLAEKIISSCRSYLSSIRDAPSDLRSILIEVSSLKSIVENLQFLVTHGADGDHSQIVQDLNSPDGPIHGCREALAKLEKVFPPTTVQGSTPTKRRATNISLAQLAWPFQETPRGRAPGPGWPLQEHDMSQLDERYRVGWHDHCESKLDG